MSKDGGLRVDAKGFEGGDGVGEQSGGF